MEYQGLSQVALNELKKNRDCWFYVDSNGVVSVHNKESKDYHSGAMRPAVRDDAVELATSIIQKGIFDHHNTKGGVNYKEAAALITEWASKREEKLREALEWAKPYVARLRDTTIIDAALAPEAVV